MYITGKMALIHDSVGTISVLGDEWKSIRKKHYSKLYLRMLLSGYIITCFKKQSVAEILFAQKACMPYDLASVSL